MLRKPNYHFDTKTDTGLDEIPIGSIVVVENYDGKIKSFYKNAVTVPGSTIEQMVATEALKDIASDVKDSIATLDISSIDLLQTTLDAKVNGTQVLTDVPSGAKFTDTVYSKPSSEPKSYIVGLETALNSKVDDNQVLTDVPSGAKFTDTIVDVSSKANTVSPTFTGVPTAPTAPQGTNTTQVATTAFVEANIVDSIAAIGGGLKSVQVFTSSGTWTKPAGINLIKVTVVGGGGGGGRSNNSTTWVGGNGAGAAIKFIDASSITSETVTIGTGGSRAASNGSLGTSGGGSSFGAHCSSLGGNSGVDQNVPVATTQGIGGDVNIYGGGGVVLTQYASKGGGSIFGEGGVNDYNSLHRDALVYGSGGAGSTTGISAGSGKQGIVIIEEYA